MIRLLHEPPGRRGRQDCLNRQGAKAPRMNNWKNQDRFFINFFLAPWRLGGSKRISWRLGGSTIKPFRTDRHDQIA
jgi:hypothetical protein